MSVRLLPVVILFLSLWTEVSRGQPADPKADSRSSGQPNLIFVLSDDTAQGDLGCYGQQIIQTPHLDRMAREGTRYLQAYSGTSVCAPSRASLMTGLHCGHCPIRGNYEVPPEGQLPLPADTTTVAEVLKSAGYATACAGKWGMGYFDTPGSPLKQGFDHFFGYNCQREAHSYFPKYLYDDDRQIKLQGNDGRGIGQTYAQDLIQNDVIKWIKSHHQEPFFVFYAVTLPHGRHEIDDLGIYADKPWSLSQKSYAAQITRLDRDMGQLLQTLEELGIDQETLVIFTGDNGSSFAPESEMGSLFKQADNGLRGYKRALYEGALRQAAIAWWPGTVPAGRVTDGPWAFWDYLPTAAELAGAPLDADVRTDGKSLVRFLKGGDAPTRDYFYWELHEGRPIQACRFGEWKAVKNGVQSPIELYNLEADRGESENVAESHPEVVQRAASIMDQAHESDPNWPLTGKTAQRQQSEKAAWQATRQRREQN
ncbi:arylsulfatase [Roseiconus nitratireducens]|uniref:Arylsulfatase n=1 Tax=Roseiconus nitratireducens TaxID=2605748 RepID=A0A5M6CWM3_9BACT|nr:arylsulfatase [Roseiconus nitratireducens]KAA5539614.1 arylsulfatase [Roseiconus nitratireducens]